MLARIAVVIACVAGTPLALAACSDEERSIVQGALEQEIESADVVANLRMTEDGAKEPLFAFSLAGPMTSNGSDRLPSFDWRIRMEGEGEEPTRLRLISSGRNIFVEADGKTYEVGEELTAQLNEGSAAGEQGEELDSLGDVEDQGIDLQSWFPESDTREDSRVAGEETTRVTGVLDLSKMLADLRELATRGPLASDPLFRDLRQLGPRTIRRIDRTVTDPRFAVEAAKEDGGLRRIAGEAKVREDGGSGSIRFDLTLSGVGEDKRIDVPESGRPIQELLRGLGGGGVTEAGPELEVQ